MRTFWIGTVLAMTGVLAYFGITAWIFLSGNQDEPLTGAQGTYWTLAVTAPFCLGLGLVIGSKDN